MTLSFREALDNFGKTLCCPLCHGILVDPASIIGCRHLFCRECVFNPLGTKGKCPVCLLPAQPKDISKNIVTDSILYHYVALKSHFDSEEHRSFLENKNSISDKHTEIPETQHPSDSPYETLFWAIRNEECKEATGQTKESLKLRTKSQNFSKNCQNGDKGKLERKIRVHTPESKLPEIRRRLGEAKFATELSRPLHKINLKIMILTGKINRGSIFSLFDCQSRLTKNGTLRDYLDGEEYTLPEWICLVCQIVLKNPRSPIIHMLVDGKPFQELLE